ncbi:hypothetical protein STEG23_031050 [Scotinomys teguina]
MVLLHSSLSYSFGNESCSFGFDAFSFSGKCLLQSITGLALASGTPSSLDPHQNSWNILWLPTNHLSHIAILQCNAVKYMACALTGHTI